MKKLVIFTALSILATSAITLNSCKKILKYDLPLRAGYVIVRIPKGDSSEQVSGASTNYVDIDSVVKEGTGKLYGFKNITSIKLTSITMSLINYNDSNNFANFKDCFVSFSTNSGTKYSSVYQAGLFDNPDSRSTFVTIPNPTDELKSYLIGNQFNITGGGVLRRRTTDTLKCQIQVEFNIHVN